MPCQHFKLKPTGLLVNSSRNMKFEFLKMESSLLWTVIVLYSSQKTLWLGRLLLLVITGCVLPAVMYECEEASLTPD